MTYLEIHGIYEIKVKEGGKNWWNLKRNGHAIIIFLIMWNVIICVTQTQFMLLYMQFSFYLSNFIHLHCLLNMKIVYEYIDAVCLNTLRSIHNRGFCFTQHLASKWVSPWIVLLSFSSWSFANLRKSHQK